MDNSSRISGGYLTALLLSSRLSNCLLLPADKATGLSIGDRLAATALGGVFLFLLFVPTLCLLRGTRRTVVDEAYRHGRIVGRAVGGAYVALCLFVLCLDVVQFCDFAETVMPAAVSVTALAVSLVLVAFVASFYGIRTLARTALPVAAFSALTLIVLGVVLLPEMNALHFPPLSPRPFGILTAALGELPRTAETVAIGLLYPYVKAAHARALAAFSLWTVLFTALVSTTALAVLGDFAAVTAYPYYTATTAAGLGVFQRLDLLVTAVWLGTFFMRLALFCALLTDTAHRVFGRRARVVSAVLGAVLLSLFAVFIRRVTAKDIVTAVYVGALAVFCVVLPVVLLLGRRRNA